MRKRKRIRGMILALLLSLLAAGQVAAKDGSIGVVLGYSAGGYREETYANLIQRISTLSFQLQLEKAVGNYLHRLSIGYYNASPDSVLSKSVLLEDYDPLSGESLLIQHSYPVTAHRGFLEYALVRSSWGSASLGGYAGLSLRADAWLQFAHYPSITAGVSLGPHVVQFYRPDDASNLSLAVGIPLLGWVVRPPYAGADALLMKYAEENPLKIVTTGNLSSLHNYRALFCSLRFSRQVTSRLGLMVSSDLSYGYFAAPRPRRDLEWSLSSGASVLF